MSIFRNLELTSLLILYVTLYARFDQISSDVCRMNITFSYFIGLYNVLPLLCSLVCFVQEQVLSLSYWTHLLPLQTYIQTKLYIPGRCTIHVRVIISLTYTCQLSNRKSK